MKKDDLGSQVGMSLRLRWSFVVGSLMACIVFVLTLFILDLEERAWLATQNEQSILLTNVLGNQLRIPMLSYSAPEVELIIASFLRDAGNISAIELYWEGRGATFYGARVPNLQGKEYITHLTDRAVRVSEGRLWYIRHIHADPSSLDSISVLFSSDTRDKSVAEIKNRLLIAALIIILLSCFVIYWVAGRMSRRIELLAKAAQLVAEEDFTVRLPVHGSDELSVATRSFNRMVAQLSQKERIRQAFSRYLNPKLIEKLFAEDGSSTESHQQPVTILFADMVSFTSYSQVNPPEVVVKTLNAYFEVFYHIIDQFSGNVDKYIGDAVMVVFNHPFEDNRHLKHAVMTGLCMVEACQRLGITRSDGSPIAFRIGIDQGNVIVGNIGARQRLEYTVIGNTVNIASRMAGLGLGVIASHAVFEALGFGFEMQDFGLQAIKGIDEPVRCVNIFAGSKKVRGEVTLAVDAAFSVKEAALGHLGKPRMR